MPRGFRPNRWRGQNLLLDQSIADRIVGDADLPAGANVLEIGAGSGVLTSRLARVAGSLAAVEVDYELAAALRDTTKKFDNVKVIRADARDIDVPLLFEGAPFHVVANLPYSVGTPLTVDLVKDEYRPVSLTVMLQREVADRMCAGPGDMALLSVLVQSFAVAGKLFEVPPKAFWPRPKVHSAVVRLVPNEVDADEPLVKAAVFLARLGFASRRKMLHNSLAGGLQWESERVTETCRRAGVESSIRPEELGLDKWKKLAEAFVAEGILERSDRE